MKLSKKIIYLSVFSDFLLFCLSWISAYYLRNFFFLYFPLEINPIKPYIQSIPIMGLIWIFSLRFTGFYKRKKKKNIIEESVLILKAIILGMLITMSFSFMLKEFSFGRSVVIFFTLINLIFLSFSRYCLRRYEKTLRNKKEHAINSIIVGTGEIAVRMMQRMEDDPEIGYTIVGFLDDDKKVGDSICGKRVLGKISDLGSIVNRMSIDSVFFAKPEMNHENILNIVEEYIGKNILFNIVSTTFEMLSSSVEMIGEFPVINIKGGRDDLFYLIIKRVTDISFSLVALLLSLPLFIIIAYKIKRDSNGKIILRQERIGKGGKNFTLYKFRTMYENTKLYDWSPSDHYDKRITPFGRFLRKSSLDELPQIINVLKGEMSLVGPRPEMPFIVEKYKKWQRSRLEVLPGITGLWQILGRKDIPLFENLEYDFYYIRNRSVLFDVSIILKTIPALLGQKGAY